jgi:hypothetical protein
MFTNQSARAYRYISVLLGRKPDERPDGSPWTLPIILAALLAVFVFMLYSSRQFTRLWAGPQLLYGAEGSDTEMLVIQKGGRYGYGDAAGNVLIEPAYEDARPFFEGLAAVKEDGRYGYIDTEGNTVIPFRFVDALDFHGGCATVGANWVAYEPLRYRSDCCIIDRAGNVLKDVDFSPLRQFRIGEYREGFYVGSYYLMDSAGNLLHSRTRIDSGFHEGLARKYAEGEGQCFINSSGNAVLTGFQAAGDFCGGLAPAKKKDGKWGYIDRTGAFAIRPAYEKAFGFGEGLALVKEPEDFLEGWAIIDTLGNKVCDLPGMYMDAGSFSEGLCAIGNGSWGFVDSSGKLVIECRFGAVSPFINGIAEVLLDGKTGYIDRTGKYIWEPK